MPTTAPTADFLVTCDPANGGSCGDPGSTGQNAFIVNGRTTDGSITNTRPFDMPAPVHKFATFSCNALSGTSVTIKKEAWAAVLGTSPTRIETRVIRGKAKLGATTNTNVVVGHSLVGYTNVP
jgi:hypothetical protein